MLNPIWHLSTVGDYPREPAREASRSTGEGVYDRRRLEDRLERLALICMGMWSLLQSTTDLMDGVVDGKITHQVCRCGRCDRPMSSRHNRCIYCGSEQLVACAFDSV